MRQPANFQLGNLPRTFATVELENVALTVYRGKQISYRLDQKLVGGVRCGGGDG